MNQINETSPASFAGHDRRFSLNEARKGLNCVMEHILRRFEDAVKTPLRGPWKSGQFVGTAGSLPRDGMTLESVLNYFESELEPGFLSWNHPRFFGFFNSSTPIPALMAEILVSGYNTNRMTNDGSPASAEIDEVAGRWLREFLGVPETFETQFYSSASLSFLHALNLARSRATGGIAEEYGISRNEQHRIYQSVDAHFFARKMAVGAGIGRRNVISIPADCAGGMSIPKLRRAICEDIERGYHPLMAIATVGTTSTTAIDNVPAIAQICRHYGIFLYVDAAHAGAFAALPGEEWIRAGWDTADAVCVNPHKQLMCPLGCSALFVPSREELKKVFYQTGDYIPSNESSLGDPQDYTLLCGQRMNTLPLFFNFLALGANGMRARLAEHLRLGRWFADTISRDPIFELVHVPRLSTVCFRVRKVGITADQSDAIAAKTVRKLNDSGDVFIGKTVLGLGNDRRPAIRVTIGNADTNENDVQALYAQIRNCVETLSVNARRQSIPTWSYWSRRSTHKEADKLATA